MDKVKIAVVEDEASWRNTLSKALQNIFDSEGISAEIDRYASGVSTCQALESGACYDIYFLDIEMAGMNGIELGHLIRDRYKHDEALIFYVSSHTQYFGALFDVHTYNFIIKQSDLDDLKHKVVEAIEYMKRGKSLFEYKSGKIPIYMRKTKILYLESRGRKITITYKDGREYNEDSYRGALKDETVKLPPPDFCYPHASFIVNLRHAIRISNSELDMSNGKTIRIARGRADETRKIILRFMNKK